ncbi:MAG: TIGR01777 family protein [Bacteroidetes bacterium]|nr:TIGR01777 family protein [Bacteroidota bacterium]
MKKILIGGGSGLIGLQLAQMLQKSGYEVRLLSRKKRSNLPYEVFQWDVKAGTIDPEAFRDLDYVINLAGAGIADKRWSDARKKLIIDSRVETTRLLWKYIREMELPLKAYVSASAVGYYGDRGEALMTEDATPGDGFLSESTKQWEDAIFSGPENIRTAAVRIGIVSSTQGGALEKLILPAKYGVATYFGNGKQWFSWIHISDLCRLFLFVLENDTINGPVNGVGPNPARLRELVAGIRKSVGIPGLMLPIPEFLMRIPMGEMADVLFSSTKVSSAKAEKAGFKFEYPTLMPALKDLLETKR